MFHSQMKQIVVEHVKPLGREIKAVGGAQPRLVEVELASCTSTSPSSCTIRVPPTKPTSGPSCQLPNLVRQSLFLPSLGMRAYGYILRNTLPVVHTYPSTLRNERAVVTTMYTDDIFAHGVATLGHSLQAVGTNARLILAYFPDRISARALCVAKAGGWELQPIDRIPPP
jgi:hypothetical protein